MPRLAIVIRAVGSVESLESTLVSVLESRPADCEIIIALNRPYSDPYDLKDEVRFVLAADRTPPISAVNAALAATRAPFVHLLASGCRVSEGWADEALARFGDRRIGTVVPLVLDADRAECIFAAGVGYRNCGVRFLVAQGQQALNGQESSSIVGPAGFAGFYRKAALDFAGGFSAQLGTQQADVDMGLMLRRAGFSVAFEPACRIVASAEADPRDGAFRQALYDERLFWRNLPAANRSKALAGHAARVSLDLLSGLPRLRFLAQLAARTWASCQFIGPMRHRSALQKLEQRAVRPKTGLDRPRIDPPHAPARAEISKARVSSR